MCQKEGIKLHNVIKNFSGEYIKLTIQTEEQENI